MAALPAATEAGLVMVSPTTATPELSGRADNFFRVIPVNRDWGMALALHAREEMKLAKVFVIADGDNASYVDTFNNAFKEAFAVQGGSVVGEYRFSSRAGADWNKAVITSYSIHYTKLYEASLATRATATPSRPSSPGRSRCSWCSAPGSASATPCSGTAGSGP